MPKEIGTLYVVATPIGNLQDITLRAIEVLRQVEWVAAEDSRHILMLLNHLSLKKSVLSLHDFNERDQTATLIRYLERGESIALVSDAGTPLISDPGFYVVRTLREKNFKVVPIPGACAAIAALSAAGLPADRFTFEGFLPAKKEALLKYLATLKYESQTLIFYQAPHRLLESLAAFAEIFGEHRKAVIARELTKIHESFVWLSFAALRQHFKNHPETIRGEMVILVEGAIAEDLPLVEVSPKKVLTVLAKTLALKQAVSLTCEITGERKNTVYEWALEEKNKA